MDQQMIKNRKQRVGISGKFSQWREVNSAAPQGSVLRLIIFNLFINGLELGVSSEVATFADDTKLVKVVKTKRHYEEFKRDLSKLGEWAFKWQMQSNVSKYKVMHISARKKKNPTSSIT